MLLVHLWAINPTTQIATLSITHKNTGCRRRLTFPGSSQRDPISPLITSQGRCLLLRLAQLQVVTPGTCINEATMCMLKTALSKSQLAVAQLGGEQSNEVLVSFVDPDAKW